MYDAEVLHGVRAASGVCYDRALGRDRGAGLAVCGTLHSSARRLTTVSVIPARLMMRSGVASLAAVGVG